MKPPNRRILGLSANFSIRRSIGVYQKTLRLLQAGLIKGGKTRVAIYPGRVNHPLAPTSAFGMGSFGLILLP